MSQQLNHQRQRHRLEWLVKFIKRLSYWFSCCRLSSCTEWVRCVETSNSVECRLLRFCSSTKECKCENECMNKSWVIVVNLYTDFLSSTLLLSHHHHTPLHCSPCRRIIYSIPPFSEKQPTRRKLTWFERCATLQRSSLKCFPVLVAINLLPLFTFARDIWWWENLN